MMKISIYDARFKSAKGVEASIIIDVTNTELFSRHEIWAYVVRPTIRRPTMECASVKSSASNRGLIKVFYDYTIC